MGTKNISRLLGSKLSGLVLNFNFLLMSNKESCFYHSCKTKIDLIHLVCFLRVI